MGGDTESIKDRLDIAEVIGGYIKLEKAGANFKARCPFHTEKTPSFFISTSRQTYYCFGCGMKGDIFSFVQEIEGIDFKDSLKLLADKAGVELEYRAGESKTEKDKVLQVLLAATEFFENELEKSPEARTYIESRGITPETVKSWRIGYARADWRALYGHLLALGFAKEMILKAGLAKLAEGGKDPYDVFRDRIIFPLFDASGRVIAFSGRSLKKENEPKYLNSPDTIVFHKQEVLYGLDKAKEDIRKKNYAVLVEGQIDLVLSHQAGVKNTVASSGTAFTSQHLERLKKLSPRILLAFDADAAGEKAAEKSTEIAHLLGMEVKIARLPEGKDPAELALGEGGEWKESLRNALPAIEYFTERALELEKDQRKALKLIEKKILPLIALLKSSMEQAHYVSLISRKCGLKEEVIWTDLARIKKPLPEAGREEAKVEEVKRPVLTRLEKLREVEEWLKENPNDEIVKKTEAELLKWVRIDELDAEIASLRLEVEKGGEEVLGKIVKLTRERDEVKRGII